MTAQPSDTLLRALLESGPDAIVVVDSAGTITLANRRTAELFGYEPGELMHANVELLLPGRPGRAPCGRRKDGSEFPVEITRGPVGSDDLAVTFIRDLTAVREAAAATERLEQIFSDIDAIVWEADAERRRFHFVGRRAEEKLGYPLERWLGEDRFWRKIVHPDDRELAEMFFREAAARGNDHEFEYRVCAADGEVVWIRDRVRPIHNDAGELELAGVMVDVTNRRELEERLLQSQKMEAVGQLAGGVAHDFNNLLVVIRGYTDLLLLQATDQRATAHLRQISQAADRAAALTGQLLAFGRRTPTVTEKVDVNELLRGVEPMLRRLIGEDVALTIHADTSLEPVRVDPRHLEQALVNLVINARDAMPMGGEVRIATSINDVGPDISEELGLAPGRYVVTAVSDSGSGMTEQTKAHIFEPFFTTKEAGKGTGLGLATVHGIVEQVGGKIVVDTELGIGSTFFVYLPAARVGEAESAGDDDDDRTGVLVVEDEDAVRELVRTVLEEEGYRIYEAANGRQALELLERNGPRIDVILTDVVMPDINGPEFVSRLESLRASKVLFMSGYADSQLVNRGLRDGTVAILQKPFSPEDLCARVAELAAGGDEPSDA